MLPLDIAREIVELCCCLLPNSVVTASSFLASRNNRQFHRKGISRLHLQAAHVAENGQV